MACLPARGFRQTDELVRLGNDLREPKLKDAVVFQRELHVQEEIDAAAAIVVAGGEILRLDASQLAEFEAAVALMHTEAQARYSPELLELVGL